MSILQRVLEQYGNSETPKARTDKTDKRLETPGALPDRTDKRASVSSVSEWSEHFETQPTDWESHEIPVVIEAEQIRLARLEGEIPDCYTSSTTCKYCGTVPIWKGCPPEVLGCPWCLNRLTQSPIPSPNSTTNKE